MKKRLLRWMTAWLAAILLLSLVLPAAYAEGSENAENPPVDFVLVLDCSGSLKQTDPNKLCITATRMFLDMVPVENARIGIIGFGYPGGETYTLTSRIKDATPDLNRVHLVSPLTSVEELNGGSKDSVKKAASDATGIDGDKTPMGAGIVSAVDLLESNGSKDGNACIIVLSDGEITSANDHTRDEKKAEQAAEWAGEHGWPVYTLQLNNANRAPKAVSGRMQRIAEKSGAGAEGYYNLTDFSSGKTDVANAFLSIFNRFMGNKGNISQETTDADGNVRKVLTIENLTSETTIVASGNVKEIQLISPSGVEKNPSSDDYILCVEPGSYICAKLICPEAGDWTAIVKGDKNAKLVMYDCSMRDMDMQLTCSVTDLSVPLSKTDTVHFNVNFLYHGKPVQATKEFFEKADASLVAENIQTGQKIPFVDLEASKEGYYKALTMSDVGDGSFRFYFKITDSMFRNGSKYSNVLEPFKTENLPTRLLSTKLPDLAGFINCPVDRESRFDMNSYIENPDGDVLEYDLVCVSDRNVKIDWTRDADNYIYINNCGPKTGDFQLELSVREPNGEILKFDPFTLTVEEQAFLYDPAPRPVELWSDYYPWQTKPETEIALNLADPYYDPDGMEPIFKDLDHGKGSDQFYRVEWDQPVLKITALAEGEGVVKYVVSDGYTEKPIEFPIEIISGKTAFWRDNWIWFALAAAAIALIVIACIVISKITRVKGDWDVEADLNGAVAEANGVNLSTLMVGKKKKFLLRELLDEINYMMEGDNQTIEGISKFFFQGTPAGKIEVKGVLGPRGFALQKIPADPSIKVMNNGTEVKKSTKVSGGTLTLILVQDDPTYGNTEELTLRFKPAAHY